MLIRNVHTLQSVHSLNLTKHIILYCANPLNLQQVMRIYASFCQLVAGFQHLPIQHLDTGTIRNQICLGFTCLIIGNNYFTFFLGVTQLRLAAKLSDNGKTFGFPGLKKFLHTGKTLCDVITGHTTCMERSHRQLSTRLANGLGRNDSHRFSHLHRLTGSHIRSITFCADAHMGTAGEYISDFHCLNRFTLIIDTHT